MLDEARIEKIVALLDRRFGLEALLLFGSEVSGRTHAGSDVDFAGLFRSRPDPLALLEARADVERILGRSVDLVDLATASPILAMQILRAGRRLFGARSPALAAFEAILPSRYADLKRSRAAAEAALAERMRRGRP